MGSLSPEHYAAMGLSSSKATVSIPVGASLIDAHAGALGMLACSQARKLGPAPENRLGLICGTSACHMALARYVAFFSYNAISVFL